MDIKILMFDPDGDKVAEWVGCFVPDVDDKVRLENGDYYIVNSRTWYIDQHSVTLHCAYYGNIL